MMQILNAVLHEAHAKHGASQASPQLRQAANQFESSFLEELLKPLSDDSMFSSAAEGDPGGSMGTISSIAAQALADGIAKDGGLGIAKRVLAELAPIEAAKSDESELLAGPKCGGCAQQLQQMSDDTAGAASMEMLGQGNLISSARPIAAESSAHFMSADDKRSIRRVSAVGSATK